MEVSYSQTKRGWTIGLDHFYVGKVGGVRWPIKDINFILVLIVFLSLSTTEEMFSPRNYTFHRGKKSFLRGENFIRELYFYPWNYTFLRGIILSTAEKSLFSEERTLFRGIILFSTELNFPTRNYTFHRGKKSFLQGENFIPRNYTFLHRIILFSTELNFSPWN